jgi:hypothetical protein
MDDSAAVAARPSKPEEMYHPRRQHQEALEQIADRSPLAEIARLAKVEQDMPSVIEPGIYSPFDNPQ